MTTSSGTSLPGEKVPVASNEERETATASVRPAHRRRRTSLFAAVGVGVLGVVLVVVLFVSPPSANIAAKSPLLGKAAPPITATRLSSKRFSLTTLRGHFVVIDFFASWCTPCVKEQPELETFVMENRRRGGADLVGVIFSDSVVNVRGFLGPAISLYPVLADPTGTIAISYGVDKPPSKFLIDPSGRVVAKVVGAVTASGLEALINRYGATLAESKTPKIVPRERFLPTRVLSPVPGSHPFPALGPNRMRSGLIAPRIA